MKINKNDELAFPSSTNIRDKLGLTTQTNSYGMSKRFFAACMALSGILKNYTDTPAGSIMYLEEESAVKMAYKYADEMLKQEKDD